MLPAPRRTGQASTPTTPAPSWDLDDDEGWQDMPVVRSDDNPFGLDEEEQKKYHYRPPARLDALDPMTDNASGSGPGGGAGPSSNATGQHLELEGDTLATDSWREKAAQDESDYTRLRLDEDEESEQVNMRTKYLFDEEKAMTPLSQMQATKNILTEGQRIAYVGLCQLVAKKLVKDYGRGWEGYKINLRTKLKGKQKGTEPPVLESASIWMIKIMARLYQHMEVAREEQIMIESLAEHGVDPADLVPALMTTHTVSNPDFDPKAKKEAEAEAERAKQGIEDDISDTETEAPPPPYLEKEEKSSQQTKSSTPVRPEPPKLPTASSASSLASSSSSSHKPSPPASPRRKPINPFGDDEDDDMPILPSKSPNRSVHSESESHSRRSSSSHLKGFNALGEEGEDDDGDIDQITSPVKSVSGPSYFGQMDEDDGDIGRSSSPEPRPLKATSPTTLVASPTQSLTTASRPEQSSDPERTPRRSVHTPLPPENEGDIADPIAQAMTEVKTTSADGADDKPAVEETFHNMTLPSLPGVSTNLTSADELVTLDIRWTVLCDLFLVLIADSVYDARSRVFLERLAESLGFGWLDVVRFENRITEALEIQESLEKSQQGQIIEGRRKGALRKRYAMMGLAAVGGGLVIGLSAGLLAPVIGAGLGAAFATVGITGTTGFLAGAGGAAVITTGGVLTGANIAGKGMARRTREVRTFELRPLHNNKRVSCYVTVGGFMTGKFDDVRLPFSVLDPVIGDVLSTFWEPEMMSEMGSALKLLTSEILTQVGQQVLAQTVMTALMSALQWPMILTKLGYLIDNPWSNALDRSRAAGLVLADTLINRHAGVRPVSLIGFSLGARAIFYALVELARVKAYGLVQDVFLFGTTVTASKQTWLEVRSVIGGRFVNGYASNDWVLGYLFRATSGGLNTVAGLRPVEGVYGLENVEVTEIITGHTSYRSCMPQLLAKVGFLVTADYFDEPEDPDVDQTVQERTIVNEAEEEAKKKRKKVLGIFPRRKPTASGSATPAGSRQASGVNPSKSYNEEFDLPPEADQGKTQKVIIDDDDDDLPPREDDGDIGLSVEDDDETEAEQKERIRIELEKMKAEEEKALEAIPKTAGFDFAAISRELGKEIDVEKLKEPSPRTPSSAASNSSLNPSTYIERTGSAPPNIKDDAFPTNGETDESSYTYPTGNPPSIARAASYVDTTEHALGTSVANMTLDMSSWDKPVERGKISPTPSFNAWSGGPSSTTSSGFPMRAAPPARPHPPEFMMSNPFASDSWGNDKKDDEMATKNPW